MSDDYPMETRRRSRSKTPFLRSACNQENCEHIDNDEYVHHPKKRKPNVKIIVEETVEVTPSSSVETEKPCTSKMSQAKIKTSSEESPENKNKIASQTLTSSVVANTQEQTVSETRTSRTVVTTKSMSVESESLAISTPKPINYISNFASQYASRSTGSRSNIDLSNNEHQEQSQNVLNAERELLSHSRSGNDNISYMEYKNAGGYLRNTPKTDYTYSERSPYRRLLTGGGIDMPNMSRKSLEPYNPRISHMIQRNPVREQHIRNRYQVSNYSLNRRATDRLLYESGDDEVDDSLNIRFYDTKQDETWFMRLITTIVTTITTVCSTITGSGRDDRVYNSTTSHVLKDEQRGFFGSIAHGITSCFLATIPNIYFFISSVLYLDTWLLQSSNAENKSKKRFFLFLLILLPWLLIAGLFYFLLSEQSSVLDPFFEYFDFDITKNSIIDMTEFIDEDTFDEFIRNIFHWFEDVSKRADHYFYYLKTVASNLVFGDRD